MKKILLYLLLFFLLISGCSKKEENKEEIKDSPNNESREVINNYVSYNGQLKVVGTQLVNQYDEVIQLKGVSTHGIQWYSKFIHEENLETLKSWNANVFRLAIYTEENGYIKRKNLEEIEKYIDLVIEKDMYVIVDWHILSDGNPNQHKNEALEFFYSISLKYKNTPHVIYEICNEPNGNVSWSKDIKPYAEEVIQKIRKNSPNALIIVGTPTWSQDVLDPTKDKLLYNNILYALHFYAGTHTDWLRKRAEEALEQGIPLFVSEWGTSSADGNGGVYLEEAKKWILFMEEKNLSWCNWSLSDKNESSALLKPNANRIFNENDLTSSGQFIKSVLKN